ncbi:hypothetical protein BX616_003958 [Lobosporangium transversale]|uniref:SAM domain-containing protein n=1 Tax=Lobosporangium transversale TaxID=64571 RepID=A0A1Y2GHS0_9FUNG|nr:hypothetical protein BCR41DRAFT_397990 [Lobosporangium transversale]KAF9898490.1 hypothetical protein BX616_003958 [Lobosporangium transversale]ORZ11318.1 hypothetical protein BCR41DRAFT_397990 [Lobosporangium transversale]|eukprot:XP_021879633.1 hypothetical protein BCR41DRAFT_397990 [Lobosporangium transversale]
MATVHSLPTGTNSVEPRHDTLPEDMSSPVLPSDPEFDSAEEHQPTRTPSPPSGPPITGAALPSNNNTNTFDNAQHHYQQLQHQQQQQTTPLSQQDRNSQRTLHVPAPLRRHTSNSFMAFNEMPTLNAFLNHCNLSQYLQSFTDAGATDEYMPLMIDFDDDDLKTVMESIPMKPFHAVAFRKGIRDLRERSRMGSMHFDNSQSSFMQPEPHSTLHYSHSQFFQQPSQPSQVSHTQRSHSSQTSASLSQPSRGYSHHPNLSQQTPELYHQPSISKSNSQRQNSQTSSSQPQAPSFIPTPSQVLSGGAIYQYVGPAPRNVEANYVSQPVTIFHPEQRTPSKNEHRPLKRRRSSTKTPPNTVVEDSSPVLPEPSSFNSSSSSSWGANTPNTMQSSSNTQQDAATREMIMHQALIYGKDSSRSLTKYEHAINCAAQSLALEDPSLLTNKGKLWTKAKAKLLEEDYEYKRGKSRSKLPEAERKKDQKSSKERLVQKREANASNAAKLRVRRINSLNEQFHRKTADREALLAHLLRLESPEYKQSNPATFEMDAKQAREDLTRVENERQTISKELGSLKNKERKHQWYEKRKKDRAENGEPSEQEDKALNAGTDAEADGEAETDTTVDPDGDASQKAQAAKPEPAVSSSSASKQESTLSKPITWKPRATVLTPPAPAPTASNDVTKPTSRPKKLKDVFRVSEYTPVVKS